MVRRTTIEIDEELLKRARHALGERTTRATVEEALRRAALASEGQQADRIKRQRDVQLVETARWIEKTEQYWVGGSGAGMALAFTAVLGMIVGGVIIGQTLYSMTQEHRLELATLKALGARSTELAGFVLWQVALLGSIGGAAGFAIALTLKRALAHAGLTVVLSPETIALGSAATLAMCLLASITSLRAVFKVETAQVLR